MEMFLAIFGGLIAGSLVFAIAKGIWLSILWHLFGWRPKILDEKLVNETAEMAAASAVKNDSSDYEAAGQPMTEEQKRLHYRTVLKAFHQVIELYIKNFTVRAKM